MMKKIILQLSLSIAIFFGLWWGLNKINWMDLMHVNAATSKTEQKIGDLIWEYYENAEHEIKDDSTQAVIDSLASRICYSNQIKKDKIKIHLIQSDVVNAFALPNHHLVLNSSLIEACKNEGELCGVISHEIAHMELDHVMKALIKEIGLSVLISISTGNRGSEQIKKAIKLLTSSAYDRTLEKEADIKAVDYLIKAEINTNDFADFLSRLSNENESLNMTWISTHPESKDRAKYIKEYAAGKQTANTPILEKSTWENFKHRIKNLSHQSL